MSYDDYKFLEGSIIVIESNIAASKTTLSKFLCKILNNV